jgi:hypothetical protein
MLCLLAQDPKRISAHHRLKDRFEQIEYLPSHNVDKFLQQMAAVEEPFVLFWHEATEAALAMLSAVRKDGRWPPLLRGVVIYHQSEHAGYGDPADALEALTRYGLMDGTVHLFAPEVGRPLEPHVAELLLDFTDALPQVGDGPPPFAKLLPRGDCAPILVTAQLLAMLAESDPALEGQILGAIRWERFRKDLRAAGVACQDQPSVGVFRRLVRGFPERSTWLTCPAHGRRGHLHHTALPQQRPKQDAVADRTFVGLAAAEVETLLEAAPNLARHREELWKECLKDIGLPFLEGPLSQSAADHFAAHCTIVRLAADAEIRAKVSAAQEQAKSSPDMAANFLIGCLECPHYPGPAF